MRCVQEKKAQEKRDVKSPGDASDGEPSGAEGSKKEEKKVLTLQSSLVCPVFLPFNLCTCLQKPKEDKKAAAKELQEKKKAKAAEKKKLEKEKKEAKAKENKENKEKMKTMSKVCVWCMRCIWGGWLVLLPRSLYTSPPRPQDERAKFKVELATKAKEGGRHTLLLSEPNSPNSCVS